MPEANPIPFLSKVVSRYPRIAPAPPQKPRLLDCLGEPLRSSHSFVTNPLQDGYDIRTVQKLLGLSDVKTTMIYTQVLNRSPAGVRSPIDGL